MHVRVRKNKSGTTSIFVVACKRFVGKKNPQPLLVKSFGSSKDPQKIEALYKEAHQFAASTKYTPFLRINNENDIESSTIKNIGFEQIYGTILKQYFRIEELGLTNSNCQILRELILMRVAEPVSKLKTSSIATEFNCNKLSLNKIYKLMDKITEPVIASIKQQVFLNTKKLLATNSLNVLFYDLTTIYFENNNVSDLKMLGFSKDGKSQHVQISLALIVTEFGLPVGYEIFPGNTYEGKTLLPTLLKLREAYKIQDVTIIADSAMLSNLNINELTRYGFNYVVAARVKNLSMALTNQLLCQDSYKELNDDICYKIIDADKSQLIVCHSKKRSEKDNYEREITMRRLEKFLGKSTKNTIRGSLRKPYIKPTKNSTITLDIKKLEQMKKFDGFFGFYTNTNASVATIINQYRGLWQVEQSFRITKHNLAIRPVYHYKDRRILSHFAICFLALALVRTAEHLLARGDLQTSTEKLHRLLRQINCIQLINKNQKFLITPNIPSEIEKIYSILKIPKIKMFAAENMSLM
jgi:transposase